MGQLIKECWIKVYEKDSMVRYLPAIYLFKPTANLAEVKVLKISNIFEANRIIKEALGEDTRSMIYKKEIA